MFRRCVRWRAEGYLRRFSVLAGATILAACSPGPSMTRLEVIVIDKPQWISPSQMKHYRCAVGILVCDGGIGRLADRWCGCSDAP